MKADSAGLAAQMEADSAGLAARIEAGDARLAARIEADNASLVARMDALSVRVHTPDVPFSQASPAAASNAAIALAIDVCGHLDLPDMRTFMPDPAGLVPFQWNGVSEKLASAQLLPLLRTWVTTDAPLSIINRFLDVQPFARHSPMLLPVDGVANFAGMPNMVVVRDTILREEEAMPISSTSVVAIDWKSPAAMEAESKIAAVGHVQALAFARLRDFRIGQPVFMTDMFTGFRCWIVINQSLYFLHPEERDLNLAEGVALIRLFLARHSAGEVASVSGTGRRAVLVFGPPSSEGSAEMPPACRAPSREVSPESDGSKSDVDFETVVMSYAAALAEGGGFPLFSFQDAQPAVDNSEAI